MARQSFKFFTPRDKPKKRGPRQHKKNLNKSENQTLLTDLTKKYKDELKTLNTKKTSVTIDKNKDTSKVSAYEGTYLKPEKYTDKKDRDLSKDILNDLRKMGLN